MFKFIGIQSISQAIEKFHKITFEVNFKSIEDVKTFSGSTRNDRKKFFPIKLKENTMVLKKIHTQL